MLCRFRWVYCQLVYLRRCIPARIRHALKQLPETLDETYERTLQEIHEQNWEYAHHLFEFVAVASRPLRVEELAEFLAFDFNAGPTPTFVPDWRPEDPAQEVLSTCSSLLSIVKVHNSQVVEFSHFSVKEYLMSDRLSKSKDILSRYHVSMIPAHTIVAQACIGVLLHPDKNVSRDSLESLPLVEYAALFWLEHARVEGVSAKTQDGMKRLFDPDEPHFAAWIWVHDPIKHFLHTSSYMESTIPPQPGGSALHYAALFGMYNTVRFLVMERSQDVNACDWDKATSLHRASERGFVEVSRFFLEHGADASAQDKRMGTPFYYTSESGEVELTRLLLKHGADAAAKDDQERTPLHQASKLGVAQLLLKHGADPTAQDKLKSTPLHLASQIGSVEVTRLLLEHGVDAAVQDDRKRAPLHEALEGGHVEVAQLLLEHGADPTAQDENKITPLHLASQRGSVDVTRLLLEHGVDAAAQDDRKRTPLHEALEWGHVEVAQLLLEHGADTTAQDEHKSNPLHLASKSGSVEVTQLLLEHGTDASAQSNTNQTVVQEAEAFEISNRLLCS